MIRLLHGSDFHLGLTKFGGSYDAAADTAATLERFVDVAIESDTQVAIIAGDLFNTRHPTPRQLHTATKALSRLDHHEILTLITPGNHDGPSTIGDTETHTLGWLQAVDFMYVRVFLGNWSGIVETLVGEDVFVVAMPYPHKRAYDVELAHLPLEQRVIEASKRFSEQVEALASQQVKLPRLFIGHCTLSGASLGTERQMQMGWDVELDPKALQSFDYAALGHIHRQQHVQDTPAWYPGSPSYISFSEEADPKGFLQVEFDHGETRVSTVPSNPRPIRSIELKPGVEPTPFEPGSVVRLILNADEWTPGAIRKLHAYVKDLGAHYVDLQLRRPNQPAPEAAIRSAERSTIDLLTDFLDQRKVPREPALTVAQEIIDEC